MKPRAEPLSVHEELLTVQEVAAEYRVHEETVRRWVKRGAVRGVLVGGFRVKIRRSDVARALAPTIAKTLPPLEMEENNVDQGPSDPGTPSPDADDSPSRPEGGDDPLAVADHPAASPSPRGRHKNRR